MSATTGAADHRIERDSMGEMRVPAGAYYGAQTQRAVENFPISGIRFPRGFIAALGMIKTAAAETNVELELVDGAIGAAIVEAATEVIEGKLDDHFPIDIFQTGSGTSTNMNANEVIANRAIEIMGGAVGSRAVHPNDHVNFGQSSNDVIPTAIHVSAALAIHKQLKPALRHLHEGLEAKAREFESIVKTGRTHLQDATPVTLGQEFGGYASQIEHGLTLLEGLDATIGELAIGGTAVGTGLNTHPEFAGKVAQRLARRGDFPFYEATNHFQAQATQDSAAQASGTLKTIAVSFMKIANDLRWLGSGPRNGFAELLLPAVQPGSSIMPGKVNPVIAESVCMASAQVMANDVAVTIAAQSGNFELNVMLPVVAHNLLESIQLLAHSARNLRDRLIDGLDADRAHIEREIEGSLALCTSLAPVIGYDAAADIAKEAYKTGRTVRQIAEERGVLPPDQLRATLDPARMTQGGFLGKKD